MRSRLGKLSVLMVGLLMVVGLMGAGFASWTDTLTINGIVQTASFDVGIVDITAYDIGEFGEWYDGGPNYEDGGEMYPDGTNPSEDGTADPQFSPGTNEEGKNVASTNSYNDPYNDGERFRKTVLSEGTSVELPFYGAIREVIHNAYPWYSSGVAMGIGNAGDIPIHIVDIDFVPAGDCEILAWLVLHSWEAWIYTGDEDPVMVGSGSGIPDLEEFLSGYPDGLPFQLEPCEMLYLELFWHFEQDIDGPNGLMVLPQGKTCTFDITIDVQQWAE